ncbi:vWA domain-containing protein, partial [Enterococcus faecium]
MKKRNYFIVFCLFSLFFVTYFHIQKGETVAANEESTIEVLNNEYGKVSIRKIDHQLTILYRLNAQTQETRFLFQLHSKDAPETNLLSSYVSQEYQEYTDEQQRKWLAGYFSQTIEEKEWTIELPSTSKEFQLNIQIEEKTGQLLLSEPVSFSFSIDNKNQETAQTNEKTSETSTSYENHEISDDSSLDKDEYRPFEQPQLFNAQLKPKGLATIEPEYTTDEQGTYPKAMWQPDNSQYVRNHQGNRQGQQQWDGLNGWDGNPTNRNNSYIEYGGEKEDADYAIRKFAKETATPGLFDLYLNVRGNTQKNITPLDLVLVVDWSGSMNDNNRIGEVKIGVDRFVDTLADSGITDKINMGYVGYSIEGYSYSNGAVQMGSFDSVKNQVKSITPSWTNGGTFTQKALRDAGNMLSVPNGHKKVIVLLTDGVPTFSYKVQRVHAQSSSNYYGTQFSNTQDRPGNTSLISRIYDAPDQNNLSRRIDSTFIATIGEAMALKERGIEIHGLGIQLQSDPAAGLSKAEVESRMRQMVSSDEKGDLYYESADHATDISEYLAKKAVQISATVSNGQINDPIAEPFIYQPGTLSV